MKIINTALFATALGYTRLTPLRKPTLKRKIAQLREAGVVYKQNGQPL